jgi:hypothetical protein
LLRFNTYDREHNVNRVSIAGSYMVTDGVPINPVKTTEKTGRGPYLLFWGPNHIVQAVFTRLKKDSYGYLALSNEQKPIVQVLARTDYKKIAELPEILHNNEHSDLAHKLVAYFFSERLISDMKLSKVYDQFKEIVKNRRQVWFNI